MRYRVVTALVLGTLLLTMLAGSGGQAVAAPAAMGELDQSFGNGGKVYTGLAAAYYMFGGVGPQTMALQPDGKILVVGTADFDPITFPEKGNFALARYNTDGSPDLTFGTAGRVVVAANYSLDMPSGVALQADGKILVLGTAESWSIYTDWMLVRFNPDGTLDSSFGENGKVNYDFRLDGRSGDHDHPNALVVQDDGKILVAGMGSSSDCIDDEICYPGPGCRICIPALVRFNADGSVDSGFGENGEFHIPFAPNTLLTEQGTRKITIGGGLHGNFALARYNEDASPDYTFNKIGLVESDFAGRDDVVNSLVAAYGPIAGGGPGGKLARYSYTGELDGTFGADGKVFSPFEQITAVAVESGIEPHIIAAGALGADTVVGYYNADGSLDSRFGNGGVARFNFAPPNTRSSGSNAHTLLLQNDGKILLALDNSNEVVLARIVALPFADVPQSNPFFDYIHYLNYRRIVEAVDANNFQPFANASRRTLARWLIRAIDRYDWNVTIQHFADVPPDDPDFVYIESAYNLGVISGYSPADCPNGVGPCFKPDNPLTRGQMSKMVVNAYGWPSDDAGTPHFNDVPRTNPFYSQIETIYRRGLVAGYAGGAFRWGNNLTRGQLSKVLANALPPFFFPTTQTQSSK